MRFPPGCNWNNSSGDAKRNNQISGDQRISWAGFLLPYLEQNNLYNIFRTETNNWDNSWWAASFVDGNPCASQVVPFFLCPSDAGRDGDSNAAYTHMDATANFAKANYVALAGAGDGITRGDMTAFNSSASSHLWGVFGKNSKTTFGDISDGSSNTVLFGERASRTEAESSGNPSDDDVSYGAVWSGVVNSNSTVPSNSKDWAVFGHMFSESPENWSINGEDTPRGIASSFHPGSANVVFGDGSTRSLDENLNVSTLGVLVRMADGRVVPSF